MTGARKPAVEQRGGVTVVLLGPDFENLDESSLDDVSPTILDAASSARPPRLVIDMPHTKFFGSAFIEILFRAWNRIQAEAGGKFCISGLTPYCREVIEVTHLDRLWTLYDTADEAVEALKE